MGFSEKEKRQKHWSYIRAGIQATDLGGIMGGMIFWWVLWYHGDDVDGHGVGRFLGLIIVQKPSF